MEHDDARDPGRRDPDGQPSEPPPTDAQPEAERRPDPAADDSRDAAVPEQPAAALPDDAPAEPFAARHDDLAAYDAASLSGPMPDAPRETEPSDSFERAPEPAAAAADDDRAWPDQDLSRPAAPAGEQWPERVDPEAATAWPASDTSRAADSATGDDDPLRRDPRDDETATHPAAAMPSGPPPSEAEAFDPGAAAGAAPAAAAHAVPATNLSESTRCPRCGTENRPGLAFCNHCGQRLLAAGVSSTVERPSTADGTRACPRCGTHNRAGVAFCQNCGANLRPTAGPAGYVPPAVAAEGTSATIDDAAVAPRGAVLGPIVLLIGAIGIAVGWLLPFPYGGSSLYERAFGSGGYGAAFWSGYGDVPGSIVDQAYFGFAGPTPLFVLLLVALAIGGFIRADPGPLQRIGLLVALIWSLVLAAMFVVAELVASWSGDIVGLLRDLSPGGIIFFLASLIVLIGVMTRFARS